MDIYVKEYAWMWQRLGLSLAECRVYGYIYGLTTSTKAKQKGYKGSVRALAQMLGMDSGYVSRNLRKLIERGLITETDGLYVSAAIDNTGATIDNTGATIDNTSATIDNTSATIDNSPVPPIKEINKEMERNNNIARETLATQKPQTPSDLFEEFLRAYIAKRTELCSYTYIPQGDYLNTARQLWDALPPVAQRMLVRDIQSGAWYKGRIDWVISDYQVPEPTNYNGRSFPMGAQMVIAIYNGTGGVYTKADAELYNMTIKKEIEP